MFHCSNVEPNTRWGEEKLGRCWLVLIGAEKKDDNKTVQKALTAIVESLKYSNEKKAVLVPFKYFIKEAGDWSVLDKLDAALKKSKYDIKRFTFEDATSVLVDIFGHRVSVAYREF